jgi:hypothetical protein
MYEVEDEAIGRVHFHDQPKRSCIKQSNPVETQYARLRIRVEQ